VRRAGRHADLPESYYGAVIIDPDGHKIEVVFEEE
jgi:hypothetical protein